MTADPDIPDNKSNQTDPADESEYFSSNGYSSNRQLAIMTAFIVILFYLLNQIVPTFADDLCRTARSFNPFEILQDVYTKYFHWTGRSIVMLVNRLTFSTGAIGLTVFNLANSLMLGGSCFYAFYWAVHGSSSEHKPGISLLFSVLTTYLFLLWFTPDVFAEVLLWKTGAIQYFWSCIIVLYVMRPVMALFLHHFFNRHEKQSTPYLIQVFAQRRSSAVTFCIISFLGGAWLENVSIAIIPVWLVLLLLVAPSRELWRERVPPVLLVGLIAWCLGALFLFAAPGNYARADSIGDSLTLVERALSVVLRCYEIADKTTVLMYLLFTLILVINKSHNSSKRLAQSFIFLFLAILPALAMIGAPSASFVRRVAFPTEFFLIFATLSVFPVELFNRNTTGILQVQRRMLILFSLLLLSTLTLDARLVYRNYLGLWQQTQMREEWIIAARAAKLPLVPFLPLFFEADSGLSTLSTATGQINQQRYFARDITPNADHWKNICFAQAYDLPAVILRE